MLLVVDDEKPVRDITVRMLGDAGYRVVGAESGAQALELVERGDVQLVVADVTMPGMSGRQLGERLRQLRPEVPLLFMSGFTSPGIAADLPGPFLSKPFTQADLLRQVHALLHDAEAGV
jgi:CheY-like chemotaxis protein